MEVKRHARQFLGQQQAPDVESITGLSPAIAIDQKTTSKNCMPQADENDNTKIRKTVSLRE